LSDPAQTVWIDSNQGNRDYTYHVVVVTSRNEEVVSAGRTGAFHRVVTDWSLQVTEEESVHLRRRPSGGVIAVVAGPYWVRLLDFDASGVLLREQRLLEGYPLQPRMVDLALDEDSQRLLLVKHRQGELRVYPLSDIGIPFAPRQQQVLLDISELDVRRLTPEGQDARTDSTVFADRYSGFLRHWGRPMFGHETIFFIGSGQISVDGVINEARVSTGGVSSKSTTMDLRQRLSPCRAHATAAFMASKRHLGIASYGSIK
jgi:hypothetical protein